jgi:hypothetical protein
MIFWKNDSFIPAPVHVAAPLSFYQRRVVCYVYELTTGLSIKLQFGANIRYPELTRCGTRLVVLATSPRLISGLDTGRFALLRETSLERSAQDTRRMSSWSYSLVSLAHPQSLSHLWMRCYDRIWTDSVSFTYTISWFTIEQKNSIWNIFAWYSMNFASTSCIASWVNVNS